MADIYVYLEIVSVIIASSLLNIKYLCSCRKQLFYFILVRCTYRLNHLVIYCGPVAHRMITRLTTLHSSGIGRSFYSCSTCYEHFPKSGFIIWENCSGYARCRDRSSIAKMDAVNMNAVKDHTPKKFPKCDTFVSNCL